MCTCEEIYFVYVNVKKKLFTHFYRFETRQNFDEKLNIKNLKQKFIKKIMFVLKLS